MKKISKLLLCSAMLGLLSGHTATAQSYDPDFKLPIQQGAYQPTWESLAAYEVPEWFKNAKFGIWAHWGPQCQPEAGDWYARSMYYPGSHAYKYHVEHYGDPAQFGFKDVIHEWTATKWNPDALIRLYKSVGARYFMALGNHHDNFDLWESPYQPWNSVNMGPRKDLVGGWAEACRKYGLPLGVSIHAAHAWTWLEGSQDFDGKLTKADGKGTWWEGYDPQDLYAQNHPRSKDSHKEGTIHSQWAWGNGAATLSKGFKNNIYNRTVDLVNRYHPDMLYFDDTVLPFYPVSNEGLEIAAHLYNTSLKENGGRMQAVVTGKILNDQQKEAMVWDVERGVPDRPQAKYWQTCTCLGNWHYDRALYERNGYKSAATVVKMLVDIVSKNGNLLLSVPLRGDGSIDEKEEKILADIKAWMDIHSESIYDTRPWTTFGEGPTAETARPINNQGFNEGINYTAQDIRYVQKNGTVYATVMGWPSTSSVTLRALSPASPSYEGKVTGVELLGHGTVAYQNTEEGLIVSLPDQHPNEIAFVLKLTLSHEITADDLDLLKKQAQKQITTAKRHTGTNTGQYDPAQVSRLKQALKEAKAIKASAAPEKVAAAYKQLRNALGEFIRYGQIQKTTLSPTTATRDISAQYLVETRHFARTDGATASATRFGTPKHWTVRNFSIPKNNADGTKQGIDRYPGYNTLMMGIWNDAARAESSLQDATIYRKVSLPAGRYFFGAAYETHTQLQQAYLFAAPRLPRSREIEKSTIAFSPIAKAATDGQFHGIEFTLPTATTVYLGWVADFTQGSPTQEFRVKEVTLRQYTDTPAAK